ncbi:hypothetical protein [Shimia haliotis]|uniref:hypothetical protein n=1 Tax=Shimia haliotis TaxID=1280847 RepID=UPI001113F594|nr:hypothetical protein [Shimia haliotis]
MIKGVDTIDEKRIVIARHLGSALGQRLLRIETAFLKDEDGGWGEWPDLPIRLFFEPERCVSVAWSYFDKLFVTDDQTLPFDPEDCEVEWRANRLTCFAPLLEQPLRSIWLGQGDMTLGSEPVEIWTRLLLEFEKGWMEIYNGLDENAYAFHKKMPQGKFDKIG